MKDLRATKKILRMRIVRDKEVGTLTLSHTVYIEKVLNKFRMQSSKPVSTPLMNYFRLSNERSPKTEEERGCMSKVPYASVVVSLTYAMVYTRTNITNEVGATSWYMSNPGMEYEEAVKWIFWYLKECSYQRTLL